MDGGSLYEREEDDQPPVEKEEEEAWSCPKSKKGLNERPTEPNCIVWFMRRAKLRARGAQVENYVLEEDTVAETGTATK